MALFRFGLALLVLLALGAVLTPAARAETPVGCAALASAALAENRDAPTTILAARVERASGDLPEFCRVVGYVAPQVKFELRLPTAGWNGKFLMQGCGGMCGILNLEACEDALIRGYAVVNTDMGHEGDASTTSWATNGYGAKIDFGYRATHVVAIVSKLLIADFYGRAPSRSYFRGCSTGGRQAMIEAQRFPDDFDGIVAGAPPLDESGDGLLHLIWSARASVDGSGRQLMSPDKIPMVHAAVLAACGGTRDGFLTEPRLCRWDPVAIVCKDDATPTPNCLTTTEVEVVRKIYAGAHDASGKKLFAGGMARGSELEWVPLFIGKARAVMPGMTPESTPENARAPVFVGGADALPMWLSERAGRLIRNVMMERDPGSSFSLIDVDFSALRNSIKLVEPIYNAQNPDLRAFDAHGGKLILYHGWQDAEIPPALSIDYYDTATRTLGGPEATRTFFRFFLIPGMAHCRRGPGGDAIDYLAAIEDWVERGHAPDFLTAYHPVEPQSYMGLPVLRYPLAPKAIAWSRRIYAYPATTRYSNKGDFNAAASWIEAPLKPSADHPGSL